MSSPLVSDIIYLRIIGPILACMEPAFNPFFSLLMLLKILIILISISAALYREKKSFSLWHFVWRLKRDSVKSWSLINYWLMLTWMNISESNPSRLFLPQGKQFLLHCGSWLPNSTFSVSDIQVNVLFFFTQFGLPNHREH